MCMESWPPVLAAVDVRAKGDPLFGHLAQVGQRHDLIRRRLVRIGPSQCMNLQAAKVVNAPAVGRIIR